MSNGHCSSVAGADWTPTARRSVRFCDCLRVDTGWYSRLLEWHSPGRPHGQTPSDQIRRDQGYTTAKNKMQPECLFRRPITVLSYFRSSTGPPSDKPR